MLLILSTKYGYRSDNNQNVGVIHGVLGDQEREGEASFGVKNAAIVVALPASLTTD